VSAEAKIAQAAEERQLQEDIPGHACFSDEDFTVYFKGKCDFDAFVERISLKTEENSRCVNTGKAEAMLLVGYAHPDKEPLARLRFKKICEKAMDVSEPSKSVAWDLVSNKGPNFDKHYYDGKTFWNEEYETKYDSIVPNEPSNRLSRDAERVGDLYETVAERLAFQWPDEIDNFKECEVRAAMCCWVSDRQAGDNNGNCNTPYDERCTNADPGDNTEICAVDMARSGNSSIYMEDGASFYPGNSEGSTHCHGFAWGTDLTEPEYRYAANNLFYISMYDHMHQRGYVRNVPGSPMCGCLEKMPVVSRADCTEIEALEIWKFDWKADAGLNGEGLLTASLDRAEIEFNACNGRGRNNNLEAYYDRLYHEGRASLEDRQMVKRTLVGDDNCAAGRDFMMELKGFDVHYPAVTALATDGSKAYTISIEGGTNTGKDILYTSANGDVSLVDAARIGQSDALWTFTHTTNNGAELSAALVNIKSVGLTSFLASSFWGSVSMQGSDTLSGREKWYLQEVPGMPNTYYIKISGGTSVRDVYLSTGSSGNPDLYDMDDDTGRQRWVIKEFISPV